ncbi:hypothetical protein ACOSP7_005419 [Xanthoceras sorbifolium]
MDDCYISRGKPGMVQSRRIPEIDIDDIDDCCISRGKPGKVQFRQIPEITIVLIVMIAASRGANLAESSLGESWRQLVHCIPDCYISRGKPGIIQFRRIPEMILY